MLKGIPSVISPELLKALCEMGHGDRIVIADGNFPAESVGRNCKVIRCDGHGAREMLEAVLRLIPLDTYVGEPVTLMEVVPGDNVAVPIWEDYKKIIARHDSRGEGAIRHIERFAFYGEAESAYAVIATGETALYANIMLQKGVVAPEG